MMRDRLSLIFIRLARKLTTHGWADDFLRVAEEKQNHWIEAQK